MGETDVDLRTLRQKLNGAAKPFTAGTALGVLLAAITIFVTLHSCQVERDTKVGTAAGEREAISRRLLAIERHVDETEPLRNRFIAVEASVNVELKAVYRQLELLSADLARVQTEMAEQRRIQMQILARLPAGNSLRGGSPR